MRLTIAGLAHSKGGGQPIDVIMSLSLHEVVQWSELLRDFGKAIAPKVKKDEQNKRRR